MTIAKRKGYITERKIRKIFESFGWKVVRAGGSLGEADLVCLKDGNCILVQVKSSKDKVYYYYGYMEEKMEGFPFYIVVDFGYNKIKIFKPQKKLSIEKGEDLKTFLTIKTKTN